MIGAAAAPLLRSSEIKALYGGLREVIYARVGGSSGWVHSWVGGLWGSAPPGALHAGFHSESDPRAVVPTRCGVDRRVVLLSSSGGAEAMVMGRRERCRERDEGGGFRWFAWIDARRAARRQIPTAEAERTMQCCSICSIRVEQRRKRGFERAPRERLTAGRRRRTGGAPSLACLQADTYTHGYPSRDSHKIPRIDIRPIAPRRHSRRESPAARKRGRKMRNERRKAERERVQGSSDVYSPTRRCGAPRACPCPPGQQRTPP